MVFGDLSDDAALASLVEGADVVYHLAARMAKNDPDESRRVNVEGTERLARIAGAARVGRLVFVSSISVYAATRTSDEIITEEVEPAGINFLNAYSATKYAGEEVLRRLAAQGDGPEITIVRPTNVYGPWGRSWFLDWVRRLERVPVVVGGNVPVDLVHVDDVCAALVQAGEAPQAAGSTFHIGHETITLTDYGARVAEVVGLKTWRLPRPVDYLARVLVENGHRVLKGDRMSTPLMRRISFPHEKARRMIGYQPRVSLDEGLAAVGRWYREIYTSQRR